jgi:hypothetical protein
MDQPPILTQQLFEQSSVAGNDGLYRRFELKGRYTTRWRY